MSKQTKIGIDVYPFEDRDRKDTDGWLYELARDRIGWSIIAETPNGDEDRLKALEVRSFQNPSKDDESVLWIASEIKYNVKPATLSSLVGTNINWKYRQLRGFASGTVIEWEEKQGTKKVKTVRGFEIENLVSDQTIIANELFGSIMDYCGKTNRVIQYVFTQRLVGIQPDKEFFKTRGFEPYRGDKTWLSVPVPKSKAKKK